MMQKAKASYLHGQMQILTNSRLNFPWPKQATDTNKWRLRGCLFFDFLLKKVIQLFVF